LSSIVSDVSVVDSEKYIVQLTANSSNVVVVTLAQKFIQGSNLVLQMKAAEFTTSTSTWDEVDGVLRVGVNVSVV
jgi:hypothetical protein